MEDLDSSYAPRSPDLSGFYQAHDPPPIQPPQHQQYRGSISHTLTPFTPTDPHTAMSRRFAPDPSAPRRRLKKEDDPHDHDWFPDSSSHPNKMMKLENNGSAPGPALAVEVKTKFPVARIKRIMQADDDVGKVAQVTPVVVSKALELFMISLVTKAASEAKSRSSKRVSALHLKQAVTKDEQFDFLADIVGKIADAPAAKDNSEDGDDPIEGKKRKGGGRRKRKDADAF